MGRSKRHIDEWADRLAASDLVPREGDTVAAFVDQLRSAAADGVVSETDATIVAAEALRVAEGRLANATSDRGSRPLTIRWRRRIVIGTFLSSLFGKIAVGAAAVAVAATVTATGNLPAPAQQRVSDALSKVGIEVPASSHALDAAANATADHQPGPSHEASAPVLPAQASDTAKAVTATVFGSDLTGRAFGKAVSEAAKGEAGNDHGRGVSATHAVPAVPAIPAVPAVPGGSGVKATPGVPAVPATPAVPPTAR